MHTINRLVTVLFLLVVLVPLSTSALISLDEKRTAQQSLHEAIDSAVVKYRQRTGLQSVRGKNERVVHEQERRLRNLDVKKRELRAEIVEKRDVLAFIAKKYDITIPAIENVRSLITLEEARLKRLVRRQFARESLASRRGNGLLVLESLTRTTDVSPYGIAVQEEARLKFLRDLRSAEKAFVALETLTEERESVLAEYHGAERIFTEAKHVVEVSAAQLEEIQAIMSDVHEQVLRLQGELARIDARIRAKAERALIEKGLIDPVAERKEGTLSSFVPRFNWPVYGRVSAGFLNGDYKKYFGVPHHGLDIVVGENTPVHSAADGVVFLVRDGGAKGYTYVLVGHRGGYATLYGHLLSTNVVAGQDVTQETVIGMSGGRPGTYGAGPMTTGAHLHFEVIKAGVNIDPTSVLP